MNREAREPLVLNGAGLPLLEGGSLVLTRVKVALIGAIMLVGVAVAGEYWLPGAFERNIAASLSQATGARVATVEIGARPAWKLMLGRIDRFHADLREIRLGQLDASAFVVDADGVDVGVGALWRDGKIALSRLDRFNATLVLTQDDLNHYFWETVDKGRIFRMVLTGEKAYVLGKTTFLGVPLDLSLIGHFSVAEGGAALRFEPDRLTVEKTDVPKFVLDRFLKERLTLPVDLAGLPVRLKISGTRAVDGKLFIFAAGGQGREG